LYCGDDSNAPAMGFPVKTANAKLNESSPIRMLVIVYINIAQGQGMEVCTQDQIDHSE
jgi:hypothetical protein